MRPARSRWLVRAVPDVASVVEKTTGLVVQQSIDIPRILIVPRGEVTTGFHPFHLDLPSTTSRSNETYSSSICARISRKPELPCQKAQQQLWRIISCEA